MFKIGFSEELSFCKGIIQKESVATHLAPVCRNFLNKSIESMCEMHKFHLQEHQLAKIRSHRIGLQSDYLDINRVRKQQVLEDANIGAF